MRALTRLKSQNSDTQPLYMLYILPWDYVSCRHIPVLLPSLCCYMQLEYINNEIWANVWMTECIAKINPRTGAVT